MITLGPLLFLNGWIMLALLALPVLWWLLKVIPPKPMSISFPAIGLLMGLDTTDRSASDAPWWLILLRLLMIATIIIALAKPVLNPDANIRGEGPVVLIVDDSWQAAPGWRQKIKSLNETLDGLNRSDRQVMIQTTTSGYDGSLPYNSGVLLADEAKVFLERLTPKPWSANYSETLSRLKTAQLHPTSVLFWASNGVEGKKGFADELAKLGQLTIFMPDDNQLPIILKAAEKRDDVMAIDIKRLQDNTALPVVALAQDEDGSVLSRIQAAFNIGEEQTTAEFNLPAELRNQITRVSIENHASIGATLLMDDRWCRRPIGIVKESIAGQDLMLLSENYFLERALKPLGSLSQAGVEILLKAGQSVILLPDSAPLSEDDKASLTNWVDDGGVLVRFAGSNLANSLDDDLVPVTLRQGGRSLGGAMLWAKPQKLADFKDDSPFHGLSVPADAVVLRQVLAEPSPALQDKTWARLVDDTPLVTAEKRGDGWLILFHSTANADWSNMALSGLFVNMLEGIISLSEGQGLQEMGNQPLPPLYLYDAYGQAMSPGAAAVSLTNDDMADLNITPRHPAGFYGNELFRRALNLSDFIAPMTLLDNAPEGVEIKPYNDSKSVDLSGWILIFAMVLLAIDGLLTLHLRGHLFQRMAAIQTIAFLLVSSALLLPDKAQAQNSANDYFALQASMGTVLAYIETGDSHVDDSSFAGLAGLSLILNQRTAVEAAQPMGINPAQDELAFFPLIYWPITENQKPLSDFAIEQLNIYIANGGTLLIDTRDRQLGSLGNAGTTHLRRLAKGLNVPVLQQLPPGHVLSKSFYLLKEFPGRWRGNTLWVEAPGSQANDGVSSIVIGGNDWAGAWAVDDGGRPLFPIIPGGDEQRELAYRFGVNLVMYTLTGNYKADQVHVPAILERLGQ